jgi:DNA-binding NtrC family response regulator
MYPEHKKVTGERILVVDDDGNMQALFHKILGAEGYEVELAMSGEQALRRVETAWFDLIISDLMMAGIDGLEFIKRVKALSPTIPCILLTAYGTVESAVTAMKEGACDYLTKPVNVDEIKLVVKRTLDLNRLTRELERLRAQVDIESDFVDIVARSKAMKKIFYLIRVVAKSNATILIQGESGTGKELIARAVHKKSPRCDRPFVTVNCGALPETLLESELFGHVRGAFTGAVSSKKGLFEEAHGGTLLLDEIGETTPAFQVKLLRVLQESEIRLVGSNKSNQVDVRVIAATNKDLQREVERRTFREDLFYRLAVFPVVVPPLRERREDIPLLAEHFINKYCAQNGLEPKRMSVKALRLLMNHPWPGNVRELQNMIERAVLLTPGADIDPELLFLSTEAIKGAPTLLQDARKEAIEDMERKKITEALQKTAGNRSHAARLLGISRAGLYKKLKSYKFA